MSIADIVIIVVVALMALIGLWKGFFKSLISFCGWLVSMLIAVLIARVVAEALLDIDAIGNFVAGTEGVSLFSIFRDMLPEEFLALKAGATEAEIRAALGDGIVGSILMPFIGVLTNETIAASALTVGDGIALGMAGGLFELIVGVALFIVLRIIMTLLVLFFKSLIDKDKKQGVLSRLGGFALGAVRGALYCAVLLLAVGFMTPFSFMQPVTEEIDKGVLARPIATQVYALSGKISSNENYYNKLVGLTGLRGELPPEDKDENAEAVKDFAKNALIDEGGLFGKKLHGDTDYMDFAPWVDGLKRVLDDAAQKIESGELETAAENTEYVAGLVRHGDAAGTGNLYKALYVLANDLDVYYSQSEELNVEEQAGLVMIDFANVSSILSDDRCKAVFGTIEFTGNTAEPDLGRLDTEFGVTEEE